MRASRTRVCGPVCAPSSLALLTRVCPHRHACAPLTPQAWREREQGTERRVYVPGRLRRVYVPRCLSLVDQGAPGVCAFRASQPFIVLPAVVRSRARVCVCGPQFANRCRYVALQPHINYVDADPVTQVRSSCHKPVCFMLPQGDMLNYVPQIPSASP